MRYVTNEENERDGGDGGDGGGEGDIEEWSESRHEDENEAASLSYSYLSTSLLCLSLSFLSCFLRSLSLTIPC